MKTFRILSAAVCALALLASCQKQVAPVDEPVQVSGKGMLSIQVKGGSVITKSEKSDAEKSVSSLTVAIYNDSGACEWVQTYQSVPASAITITSLSEGQKTICAAANFNYTPAKGDMLSVFTAKQTLLSDNATDRFVMFGSAKASVSATPETAKIELLTVAAKFNVAGKIITDWEGEAPSSFSITDIYLTNAGSKSDFNFASNFAPEVNPRNPGTVQAGYESLTRMTSDSWASGSVYNANPVLYAYPNDGSSADTYLIIKALYDGEVCYYPLNINKKIGEAGKILSNTCYKFGDITITAKGTEHPWIDFDKVKVIFSIIVSDWDDQDLGSVTF